MIMPLSIRLACELCDIRALAVLYLGCLVKRGYTVVLKECFSSECGNEVWGCVPISASSEARG